MTEQQSNSGIPENESSAQDVGDTSERSEALERQRRVDAHLNKLIESLAAEVKQPGIDVVAESYFTRLGVHETLLSSGILSRGVDNPYHPEKELDAFNQWWEEHPDVDPWQADERYQEVLTHLYVGARLGFLAGRLLERVPLQRIDDSSTE